MCVYTYTCICTVCAHACAHLMLPDACVWMSEVSIRLRKNGLLNLEFVYDGWAVSLRILLSLQD